MFANEEATNRLSKKGPLIRTPQQEATQSKKPEKKGKKNTPSKNPPQKERNKNKEDISKKPKKKRNKTTPKRRYDSNGKLFQKPKPKTGGSHRGRAKEWPSPRPRLRRGPFRGCKRPTERFFFFFFFKILFFKSLF